MKKNGFMVTFAVTVMLAFVALVVGAVATAATKVVVTQNNTTWTQDDTRGTGTVSWTSEFGAPAGLGNSSLKLTTTLPTDKAGLYNHTMFGTQLSTVTALGFWTYQLQPSTNPPHAAASYQLQIRACGDSGFTTLVYEPYWNGTVVANTWQQWDVDQGLFWSSRTVTCGTSTLVAGAGGPPLYTLAQVQAMFPNAVVVGIGVNIGTNNPGYYVGVDGVLFNDTLYDFEIGTRPTSKDQCKDGGWMSFNEPAFKNQGDCVSYAATGGRNGGNG